MRRYKHELIKYLKWKKHYAYVESRTLELRAKICRDATMHGTIGVTTRKLYLKYNPEFFTNEEMRRFYPSDVITMEDS